MRFSMLLFMSPLFLVPLYDLIFYIPSSIFGPYGDLQDLFPIYLIVQSILYLFFLFFLFLKKKEVKPSNRIDFSSCGMGSGTYVCFFLVCIFLFFYLFYSVFSDFNLIKIFTQNARFYAKSKVGTAWVFFLYQFFLFMMLFDMYKSGVKKHRVIIFIFCVLIIALTGGRSSIISYMVFLVYIATVVHDIKISRKLLLTLSISVIVIFSGNALLRSSSSDSSDSSFVTYISSDAFLLDFDNSFILQDSIDYYHNNEPSYFIFIEDLMYTFLPRAIYPDKPVSTAETRLVYSDLLSDGRTTNYTFGIYGNAFLNFGHVGFLLAIIATISAGIKYHDVCNRVYLRKAKDFLYLYFFMMFILVLRGGYFNVRILMSFIVVILVVLFYKVFVSLRYRF